MESVWDYPRPPRLEGSERRISVVFNGETIAETTRAYRVLETSHPPVYYLPPDDLRMEFFLPTRRRTFCEFKGAARYYTITVGTRTEADAAWSYERPTAEFAPLAGYVAIYPGRMDACYVDDELVSAQPGDFYGGWITSEISGPFKGGPGTEGW